MKEQNTSTPNLAEEMEQTHTTTHRAPYTDPTNPCRQEAAGIWTHAAKASVRQFDEPGLTDEDRDERAQAQGSS